MGTITIIDVIDESTFRRIPPCADPGFDHRSCDYWEDDDRGSKAARRSWLKPSAAGAGAADATEPRRKPASANPFLADLEARAPAINPFAVTRPSNPFMTPGEFAADGANAPFAADGANASDGANAANEASAANDASAANAAEEANEAPDDHEANDDQRAAPHPRDPRGPGISNDQRPPAANPFAPPPPDRPVVGRDAPPKLKLLGRGLGVVGSYAKVLLVDDVAAVYAQFGPLTAYPRAQRTRDLYPSLPDAPLPAVITCIASTPESRSGGLARALVEAVCDDLTARGFTAVETYPTIGAAPDATSAATPGFWVSVGFALAIEDDRFPVMRRELT